MSALGHTTAKHTSFNADKLFDLAYKGERDRLNKIGAFIMTRSSRSMRTTKGPSAPGTPPHAHLGLLKKLVRFASNPILGNVIVGPMKTNQVFFRGDGKPVTGTVPETLEKGGTIRILEVRSPTFRDGRWVSDWHRADLRSKRRLAGKPTRLRAIKIAARPYMGPAFEKEVAKAPELFVGLIGPR